MPYSLLVVEDEFLVRSRVRLAVESSALPLSIAAEADDGEAGIALLRRCLPSIAVVDINMPSMDGLTFTRKAKELMPGLCVIILTGYRRFEYAATAVNLGVFRFLLKPLKRAEVIASLRLGIERIERDEKNGQVSPALSAMRIMRKKYPADQDGGVSGRVLADNIRSVIETRFQEPGLSLDVVANDVCRSRNYVSEVFSTVVGRTVIEYATELRLTFAREVLSSGRAMLLDELAMLSGYSDPYYFSKCFKKRFGASPARIGRLNRSL